jgi:hypothetical protein
MLIGYTWDNYWLGYSEGATLFLISMILWAKTYRTKRKKQQELLRVLRNQQGILCEIQSREPHSLQECSANFTDQGSASMRDYACLSKSLNGYTGSRHHCILCNPCSK